MDRKQPFVRDEWRFEVSLTFPILVVQDSQVCWHRIFMKGGYTEAELLAAEWSKQRKKQNEESENRKDHRRRDDQKARLRHENAREYTRGGHENRRISDSRDRYGSSKDISRGDRFDRRSDFYRNGDQGGTSQRYDDRAHRTIEIRPDNDNGRRDEKVGIDEFGREIVPGRMAPTRRRDSPSRSRSRSPARNRSRSRSRSRQRVGDRREVKSWKHDKNLTETKGKWTLILSTMQFKVYTSSISFAQTVVLIGKISGGKFFKIIDLHRPPGSAKLAE